MDNFSENNTSGAVASSQAGEVGISVLEEKDSNRIILYIFGAFLVLIVVWGVIQIKIMSKQSAIVPANVPTQEELIQQRLKELTAQNAANQVEVSPEEVQTRLEELAAQNAAANEEVMASEEEVQAQLEALTEQNTN